MIRHRSAQLLLIVHVLGCLSGCYYVQVARGQLEVMQKREPIADVIESEDTPATLSERLQLIGEARRYSIEALGLPDNDSYRSYADIERDYVVWNVFAAPEFSLQPKRWCFPVAGCVSYRGYFTESAARRQAARLRDKGYDVAVGGVSAYSTLGRFDDPVLSTMMRWDDVNLVATLFHELAHQVLYVKGDSGFNESFATAVEEIGMERWLRHLGRSEELDRYEERRALRGQVMRLVEAARDDMRIYYSETIDPDEKRLLKQHRIEQLVGDIRSLYQKAGREAPSWLTDLNNARIASMTLYEGHLPAFRALLAQCDAELDCFYAQAVELAGLDADSRSARLEELLASRKLL